MIATWNFASRLAVVLVFLVSACAEPPRELQADASNEVFSAQIGGCETMVENLNSLLDEQESTQWSVADSAVLYYPAQLRSAEVGDDFFRSTNGDVDVQTPYLAPLDSSLVFIASSPGGLGYIDLDKPSSDEFRFMATARSVLGLFQLGDSGGLRQVADFSYLFQSKPGELVKSIALDPECSALWFSTLTLGDSCLRMELKRSNLSSAEPFVGSPETVAVTNPCISNEVVSGANYGGQLEIGTEQIFWSIGDFELAPSSYEAVEEALASGSQLRPRALSDGDYGKVLKLENGQLSVFSSGHRNPQGLALDPLSGNLWSSEHGPWCGDELNLILLGRDYGWPEVSIGIPYGAPAPEPGMTYIEGSGFAGNHSALGFEAPVFSWGCAKGPGPLTLMNGVQFPTLEGYLLQSSMKRGELFVMGLDNGAVTSVDSIVVGARIRDLASLPSGSIVMVSDDGRVFLLSRSE